MRKRENSTQKRKTTTKSQTCENLKITRGKWEKKKKTS